MLVKTLNGSGIYPSHHPPPHMCISVTVYFNRESTYNGCKKKVFEIFVEISVVGPLISKSTFYKMHVCMYECSAVDKST